jgi:hypothetical protein
MVEPILYIGTITSYNAIVVKNLQLCKHDVAYYNASATSYNAIVVKKLQFCKHDVAYYKLHC